MSTSYALVTLSYWRDVERCQLLVESVDRWVPPDVRHYLVIAKSDVHLFRNMLGGRFELIVAEDIIPPWLFQVPGARRFWLSTKTLPVRNWMLQQIVKLSVPAAVTEDVLLVADSDMFFIAPFDPRDFECHGEVPLFLETGQRGLIPHNDQWHAAAARLLGLPVATSYDTNYVNQLIWWRRKTALEALRRVENVRGREWAQAVAALRGFSEYTFYGVYVDGVPGPEHAGHWHDGVLRTLNYWPPVPLDEGGLKQLKSQRLPHHHSVMVSSKSNTEVADIRHVFWEPEPAASPRTPSRRQRRPAAARGRVIEGTVETPTPALASPHDYPPRLPGGRAEHRL